MKFKIETPEEREAQARALIIRLGLDPETATAEDVFAAYEAEDAQVAAEMAAEDELAREPKPTYASYATYGECQDCGNLGDIEVFPGAEGTHEVSVFHKGEISRQTRQGRAECVVCHSTNVEVQE